MSRDRQTLTLLSCLVIASTLGSGELGAQSQPLSRSAAEPFAASSREPVSYGWLISAERPLEHRPAEPRTESRRYWIEADASELRAGVELHTMAEGAIVRLQPTTNAALSWGEQLATAPEALVLTTPTGATLRGGTGFELALSPEQLRAAEVPFDGGTTVFRLAPELGAGSFRLAAPDVAGDRSYRIHLFDRESDLVLAMYAESHSYLDGENVWARARFEGQEDAGIERARVRVVAPSGDRFPVSVTERGGEFFLHWPVDAAGATAPGLWELEVEALGSSMGRTVVRFGRLPFSVAMPTARLLGSPARVPSTGTDALRVSVPLEVGVAGRYEVRGVLYGGSGRPAPRAVGQTAAWFEPGAGELVLEFPLPAGAAEWKTIQLVDLELRDQSRMGVLLRSRGKYSLIR